MSLLLNGEKHKQKQASFVRYTKCHSLPSSLHIIIIMYRMSPVLFADIITPFCDVDNKNTVTWKQEKLLRTNILNIIRILVAGLVVGRRLAGRVGRSQGREREQKGSSTFKSKLPFTIYYCVAPSTENYTHYTRIIPCKERGRELWG